MMSPLNRGELTSSDVHCGFITPFLGNGFSTMFQNRSICPPKRRRDRISFARRIPISCSSESSEEDDKPASPEPEQKTSFGHKYDPDSDMVSCSSLQVYLLP